MINCGATLDIIDLLQPPEESIFYIIDSLRPLEVRNVYNGVQIKIICLQTELGIEQGSVPEFEDIFDEDEEEEKNEEDEESGDDEDEDEEIGSDEDEAESAKKASSKLASKRRRFDPEYLEKMQKRRDWEAKRFVLFC